MPGGLSVGLNYARPQDVLLVNFLVEDHEFKGKNWPRRGSSAPVDVLVGDDGRVYAVYFRDASQWLPAAVLKGHGKQQLVCTWLEDDPEALWLPLFPDAWPVGRRRVEVQIPEDGPLIELVKARSERIVGLIVRDARRRLPERFLQYASNE